MTAGLHLDNVTITGPQGRLFPPVTLQANPGATVALLGPSGIGKSSLILAICGQLSPPLTLDGDIQLDGRSIVETPTERRQLGVLFQDALLLPHLSVKDNIGFALPRGLRQADRRARIATALEVAGLSHLADRRPANLSGGEALRVALFRALCREPRALLLDEPYSKLDGPLRTRLRTFVRDQIERANIPALLVTHDEDDCAAMNADIVRLSHA